MNRYLFKDIVAKKLKYFPWTILPLPAFVVALVLTHAQQSQSYVEAFKNNRFWIAFLWSFLPACLLIAYVQALCYKLDESYGWRKEFFKRLKKQLLLGVLLPALFLAGYFTCYFAAYGRSVIDQKYFQIEFPMAVIGLVALNSFYLATYLWRVNAQTDRNVASLEEKNALLLKENNSYAAKVKYLEYAEMAERGVFAEELEINSNGMLRTLRLASIIYIVRLDKIGWVLLDDGSLVMLDDSLDRVKKLLDERIFSKCNRWYIVNLTHIAYTSFFSDNVHKITYKEDTKELLAMVEVKELELLEKHGIENYRLSEKYVLNRSFWKSVEEKLEVLI